jgi:excisionase family DNA binding protein
MNKKFITRNELAAILKISPRTVDNLVIRKKIPSLKIGHCVRFEWEAVQTSLEKMAISSFQDNIK